jgi:hypothetical protein
MLFCLLFYGCLIHPLRQELSKTHRNIASLESALAEKEAARDQLAQASSQLALQRRKLAELLSELEKHPSSPLQVLQELALSNGVEIGWSKTPSQRRTQPGEHSSPVSLRREVTVDLRGRFLRLRSYLEDVSGLKWAFGIKSCVFESDPNHHESNDLRARLVVEVPTLESHFHEANSEY